jgi:hypothetical protein
MPLVDLVESLLESVTVVWLPLQMFGDRATFMHLNGIAVEAQAMISFAGM